MKNVYDGATTLDENGEALITLPEWFEALNSDFRYLVTCIGGAYPVYIVEEINDNQFKIAGGRVGMRVTWQVTGIRQDPGPRPVAFRLKNSNWSTSKAWITTLSSMGSPGRKACILIINRMSPSSCKLSGFLFWYVVSFQEGINKTMRWFFPGQTRDQRCSSERPTGDDGGQTSRFNSRWTGERDPTRQQASPLRCGWIGCAHHYVADHQGPERGCSDDQWDL